MIAGYVVKEVQEEEDVYKVNEMRGDDSDKEDGNETAVLETEV